ncbi:DNA mismatch repair protein MutT [Burkholderia ubonensis]|uniref:NUDIX hydrolase n=1 Tax=Burkholderia ubonensis TaxID=101571 RepID=UPI0008FDA666|nr:NUDIX domain-containing protein [Burkholderia ubonensis]OJB10605.1 DNA mismatch repair protein MutT [Burkholderia ubonensis]OJB55681.1 DNA mismatch repair protein MutT [Burkholderia ubonensis]
MSFRPDAAAIIRERATIVCRQGTRILLVARRPSRWSLPGGMVKRRDSPLAAAHRELWEETGLVNLPVAYAFQFGGLAKLHHVFVADVAPGAMPRARNEIAHCSWFEPSAVASLPTSVSTQTIVELVSGHTFARLANVAAF